MRDYRYRKHAAVICIYGGCWERSGSMLYCPTHAAQRNQYDRHRRATQEGGEE